MGRRYTIRRVLARIEWTRFRVKPGGTAEVMYRFCPSSKS